MKRLLILGGGISGLIANWVFRQCRDLDVRVIDPGKLGGDFLAGGLRYIHRTDEMASLLHDLGVVYTNYNVQGGILLRGKVEPYPNHLKTLSAEAAERIQHDHYRKTRRTEPDAFADRSMNDPESQGPRKSLRCDLAAVISRLATRAVVLPEVVERVEPHKVVTRSGATYGYDLLINTLPFWVIRRMVWFQLPEALALKLNIVNVDQNRDPYAKWDYVYTPYTPEKLVHRISPYEGGSSCEFNGEWKDDETNDKLTSELNFLFPDGWALGDIKKGLNGHLLPMASKPAWPQNIKPLGRFAQWNTRATSDVVLSECHKIVNEWDLRPSRTF